MAVDPSSLLTTLQAFTKAQETRRSLSTELDAALSTYLSSPVPPSLPSPTSSSTCATEAIRPPNEAELSEVLRIGFTGLMEVRTEVEVLEEVLRGVWKREDLAEVVGRVEEHEVERLKETVRRDQLRRLAVLEPEEDFGEAIAEVERRRQELAMKINDESEEIKAEIAELILADEA